jgi:hypothetical protein
MSDDYAKDTASPSTINLGGTIYQVGKFGPRALGDLQAYLKRVVPDPRLMARELCRDMSDAVAAEIWRDLSAEARDWPPAIDSHQGNMLLTTTSEGAAQVVWVLLRRHNPTVDLARATEIAADLDTEQINELIRLGWPQANFAPKDPGTSTEETNRGPVPVPTIQ